MNHCPTLFYVRAYVRDKKKNGWSKHFLLSYVNKIVVFGGLLVYLKNFQYLCNVIRKSSYTIW